MLKRFLIALLLSPPLVLASSNHFTKLPDWIEALIVIAAVVAGLTMASHPDKEGEAVKAVSKGMKKQKKENDKQLTADKVVKKADKVIAKDQQEKQEVLHKAQDELQKLLKAAKNLEELEKEQAKKENQLVEKAGGDVKKILDGQTKDLFKKELDDKGAKEKLQKDVEKTKKFLDAMLQEAIKLQKEENKQLEKEIEQEREAVKITAEEEKDLLDTIAKMDQSIVGLKKRQDDAGEKEETSAEELMMYNQQIRDLVRQRDELKKTVETAKVVPGKKNGPSEKKERDAIRTIAKMDREIITMTKKLKRERSKRQAGDFKKRIAHLIQLREEELKRLPMTEEREKLRQQDLKQELAVAEKFREEEVKLIDLLDALHRLNNLTLPNDRVRHTGWLYYVVRDAVETEYHLNAGVNDFQKLHDTIAKIDHEDDESLVKINNLMRMWEMAHRTQDIDGNDVKLSDFKALLAEGKIKKD